jgi:hypothetical protein
MLSAENTTPQGPPRAQRKRHRWSEPVRFLYKTERSCLDCDIVKVTRHEPVGTWIEFWRGFDRVSVEITPECSTQEQPQ